MKKIETWEPYALIVPNMFESNLFETIQEATETSDEYTMDLVQKLDILCKIVCCVFLRNNTIFSFFVFYFCFNFVFFLVWIFDKT